MTSRRTIAWLLACATLFAQAAPTQNITPKPFTSLTTHAIETPIFDFWGESQCDGEGNLYFHTGGSGFRSGQIFKLAKDGSTGRFFQPSGKFADPDVAEFSNFWVSNDGDLFLLAIGDGHNYVIPFDDNGAMKNPITLQVPEDVTLTDLSIFDGGSMFVAGHYMHNIAGHREGEAYGAILTSSGVPLKLFSTPVPDVDINSSKLTDGAIASARGNLYFLEGDRISVISPSGELIRRIKFTKPDRESVATKLYVSQGALVVVLNIFKKSGPHDRIRRRYLALDENTGETTGYSQPPDLGWSDVCVTPNQEMIFLTSENKTHNLVSTRLR